jgi:hypothetical protein
MPRFKPLPATMNKKTRASVIASALALIILSTVGQTVHAQTSESFRFNNSAFVPGDSGTVTYYIANTAGQTISLKNLTFYFPWAGYDPSGKWQGNISINFSPWKTLVTNPAGGNVTYSNQVSFQVPSWFGATAQSHQCGDGRIRYGLFVGCVLIGTDQGNRYDSTDFSVPIAIAVYIPSSTSILTQWVPLATLVVLVIATGFLALTWGRLGNLPKKP